MIRRPTAPPVDEVAAPTFRLDGPVTGLRAGIRTDAAWRSWRLIAADWEQRLRADGVADVTTVETHAQVGRHRRRRPQPHRATSPTRSTSRSSASARAGRARRSRSPTRSRSSRRDRPVIAVVTEEFATHGRNMAKHLGHGDLAVLVLPYPLEARPDDELLAISAEYYPQALELLGVAAVTLTGEQVEVPADPRRVLRAVARRGLGRRRAAAAADRRPRSRRCSRGRPTRPTTCSACCRRSTASRPSSSSRPTRRWPACSPPAFPLVLAALEALTRPEWNAFGLTTTTSSVFPMLIVNGPSRDELGIDYRAGCMGGAGGRGSMTIGRAVSLCLRNIGGQRAGETSRTVFGQPARFGMCFGEWEERSPWPSLAQRRGFAADADVVTVHGGKGTFPLADIHNDDPRDLLFLLAKSIAYPLANMYLGNADNGEVVLAVNPMWAERFGARVPRRRRPAGVPARARVAAARPVARAEPRRSSRRRAASARDGATRTGCTSPRGPTRSCRSCAAASAACTRSRSRASARARCRASRPGPPAAPA